MKKKIIIVVTIVVVLALGGTLAFAAVDEDGNFVNPFTNILSGKVAEGAITQAEADTFSKVWEEIKGEMKRPDGKKAGGIRPEMEKGDRTRIDIDSELLEEMKQMMADMTSEVWDKLVADGVLSAEDVEAAGDKGQNFMMFMKDADEDTVTAIKEAMTELKDDIFAYLEEKVADGTLTQEQADMFSKAGSIGTRMSGGMSKGGAFDKRMPGGTKRAGTADEDTGE